MMKDNTSNSLTFEEAMHLTQALLEKIEKREVSEEEMTTEIASLVKTQNGARGFFVVYLTDDRPFADNPSTGVINALQTFPEFVSELLVKNLAMSTAMAITHRRNREEAMAQQSQRVTRRTLNLIENLSLDSLFEQLKQLQQTLDQGTGEYQNFLRKWGYDMEQKQAIQKAIKLVRI